MKISEKTEVNLDLKTIGIICAMVISVSSTYFTLKADIDAKYAEMLAEYEANQSQRDRATDYPSWQDQMDLLYHGGVDALKAELKKTKDKFPKPS